MSIGSLLGGPLLEKAADLFKSYQDGKLSKAELKFEIETLEERHKQELALAQIDVNKTEAAHKSLYVAGWRPFIGWVCGAGFALNFLVAPFATFAAQLAGTDIIFPMADLTMMTPVLMGMLGLGTLRSYEKAKGVSREK